MTHKKERQHKKPMTSKSNKRLAGDTIKNSGRRSNAKALNAATRNPTTPAGTYPAFESHLGVTALEKKHELKQAKRHKRKTRKENISLFLKTVVPVFLVAGVLLGGIMLFANNTPQNSSDNQAAVSTQVTATPQSTATATPESTVKPTPTKTSTAFIQKWCSTTPTATPYRDSNGVMQHPAGSGREAYYVPFNEDCGVRYTQAKSDKPASSSSLGDHPILLCLLLGSLLALGGGAAYAFDKATRSMEN